jgi:8-oxo-dGTP pyrophosphatase MutT (NUDIX family)
MARKHTCFPQAAAVPVRAGRICLVTSRGGKGLVIPKGHLEPGWTAQQIALLEAWEEAGLVGILHQQPVGSYRYEKGRARFEVVVFLMDVMHVVKDWPECRRRSRSWLSPARAVARIENPGLRELLRRILKADHRESGIRGRTA